MFGTRILFVCAEYFSTPLAFIASGCVQSVNAAGIQPLLRTLSVAILIAISQLTLANASEQAEENRLLNLDVQFHWIPGSDSFWFKRPTRSGDDYVVIDASTGRESKAFDLAGLRSTLAMSGTEPSSLSNIESSTLTFSEENSRLVVNTPTQSHTCNVPVTRCNPRTAAPGADQVTSPDGRFAILRIGNNLWLRSLANGNQRQLTYDGEPNFAYGDVNHYLDNERVMRRRAGAPSPLVGVVWSPNSRFVLALRQDLRPFPDRLLVTEYVPPDGAYAHAYFEKFALASSATSPDSRLVIVDTKTFAIHPVALDSQALNDLAVHYLSAGVIWWSSDGQRFYLLTSNRGGTKYGLRSVDIPTGQTREIITETARFNVRLNPSDYGRPNVFVSSKGDEVIWYSERSGHGHLYLYDSANGRVKRQITSGNWVVFDLLRVDEAERMVYFTAGPRAGDGNPYYTYLYRSSLDGGEAQLLTPEIADHAFRDSFFLFTSPQKPTPTSKIAPSGHYFVDSYSSIDQPPKVVVRKISGEFVSAVSVNDTSGFSTSDRQPPERIVAKASDGTTDLYGIIVKPRDFDPAKQYPIIDTSHPAPTGRYAPTSFVADFGMMQRIADAGFLMISVDGRGTGYRSRAFREAFLGSEDVFGSADHVAFIKNLALHRPYIDLQRVGIIGYSFGGYGALRAMLLNPDFFKVAVSAVGPGEWLNMQSGIDVERFFGVPNTSPQSRAYYDLVSNIRLAPRLQGHVLFIYGGIDEAVPLKNAFDVLDAFIKADKDIDMLIIPDSAHEALVTPYGERKTTQYLTEHLAGGRSSEARPASKDSQ